MSSSEYANTAPRSDVSARKGISRSVIFQLWLPLAAWVAITHFFSTDAFSSDESSRFIVPFLAFLFPGWSPAGLDFAHLAVRKAGHIAEYFVMGVLAYRAFKSRLAPVAFVLAAAIIDESHQLFTSTRSGSIFDVGFDLVGGVLGIWFCAQYFPVLLRQGALGVGEPDGSREVAARRCTNATRTVGPTLRE